MKKWVYLFVGWALIIGIVGVILSLLISGINPFWGNDSLINLCGLFFDFCPATLGNFLILFIQLLSTIVSLVVIGIFIFSGFYFIKINEMNKLTNWAAGLTFTAFILCVVTILLFLIGCSLQSDSGGECFAWGMGILGIPFGLAPAGILFVISVILLLINWFRRK